MALITKISSATEALQAIKELVSDADEKYSKGDKAYALAYYLKEKSFRTVADDCGAAEVRDYWAALYNDPGHGDDNHIVSFQPAVPAATASSDSGRDHVVPIRVWFVPLVSVDRVIANKQQIPSESLAIVELGDDRPHQPPFICTQKLTGSCFVFGWDEKQGRLYMGHIEPSVTHDCSFVAKYVRENEVLPIPKSQLAKYICFGGDAKELPSSYNNYTINVIGFILSDRISMVFRFDNQDKHGSMMWDLKKIEEKLTL